MKKIYLLAAVLAAGLTFVGCSKKDSSPDRPGNDDETSTPVGTPTGELISKSIGANGGEITSADGKIRVIVPAGALEAPVTIGLQPISNQLTQGIGNAYRLTPHGQQFSKPVQLEFKYQATDTTDSRPEFLDIAFQDSTGSWQMLTNTTVIKAQKKLVATTTHFSDWGYFKSIKLTPMTATVEQGAFLELKATTTFPYVDPDDAPPGTYTVKVLKKPRNLRPDEIKGWSYAGEGSFEGDGYQGFYTAPDHEPGVNPEVVTVNIQMHRKGQFMVLSNITVLGGNNVDYLQVDEDIFAPNNNKKCMLYLYGNFGNDPGQNKRFVTINGTPVTTNLWSPKIIRCEIDEYVSGPVEIKADTRVVAKTVLRKFSGKFLYERFHGGVLNAGSSNALKETAEMKFVYRGFGKPCPANVDPLFPVQKMLAAGTESRYTLGGAASVKTPPVDGCEFTTSVNLPKTTGWHFIESPSLGNFDTHFLSEVEEFEGGIEVKIRYSVVDVITGVRVQRSSSCGPGSFDPPRPLGVGFEGFDNEPILLEYYGTDELKLKGVSELKSNRLSSSILIEAWDGTGNPSHYETDGLVAAVFRDNP